MPRDAPRELGDLVVCFKVALPRSDAARAAGIVGTVGIVGVGPGIGIVDGRDLQPGAGGTVDEGPFCFGVGGGFYMEWHRRHCWHGLCRRLLHGMENEKLLPAQEAIQNHSYTSTVHLRNAP